MNDLIQKYDSLTDTKKRRKILVSICAHKESDLKIFGLSIISGISDTAQNQTVPL